MRSVKFTIENSETSQDLSVQVVRIFMGMSPIVTRMNISYLKTSNSSCQSSKILKIQIFSYELYVSMNQFDPNFEIISVNRKKIHKQLLMELKLSNYEDMEISYPKTKQFVVSILWGSNNKSIFSHELFMLIDQFKSKLLHQNYNRLNKLTQP